MTAALEDPTVRSKYRTRVRTLFISDVHLGTRTAQATRLLDFLKQYDADIIYLVGDIIDFWKVRRGPHWPQSPQRRAAEADAARAQGHAPRLHPRQSRRGPARLRRRCISAASRSTGTSSTPRRRGAATWCMHGDEFDVVVRAAKWLAFLGDRGYELALWLNNPLNWVRRHLGLGYWSLSAYLKYRVKSAVAFIGAFEEAVATEAGGATSTASSAATSTTPPTASSTACTT